MDTVQIAAARDVPDNNRLALGGIFWSVVQCAVTYGIVRLQIAREKVSDVKHKDIL